MNSSIIATLVKFALSPLFFFVSLRRFVSLQMVIDSTLFRTVCYHPEEYQIITSGTNRKVCFGTVCTFTQCSSQWKAFSGSSRLQFCQT